MSIEELLLSNEWKHITWFEGLYIIHISGDIVSIPRKGTSRIPLKLKPGVDRNGYLRIYLSKLSKKWTLKVHRLVWLTFKPLEPWKPILWHKDNNKRNPHVDNLYWTTCKENVQHAYRDWLCKIFPTWNPNKWKFGKDSRFAKTVGQFDKNNIYIQSFPSLIEAGAALNIPRQSISWVCRGINKTAGWFIWKFL